MAIFEGDVGARQSTNVKSTTAVVVFWLTSTSSSGSWSFKAGTSNYTLINTGSNVVYLGNESGVTTSTGFALGVGEQLTINGVARKTWGVTAASAPTTVIAGLASQSPVV